MNHFFQSHQYTFEYLQQLAQSPLIYNIYITDMKSSLPLLLFLLLLTIINSQVSPIWKQSPRVDTGNKLLISNHLSTTGSFNWSTNLEYYAMGWFMYDYGYYRGQPSGRAIQFKSHIQGSPTSLTFVHLVDTVAPTEIWFLEVRYIAYDGSFQQFSDITLTYKNFVTLDADISNLDNSPGSYRTQNLDTGLTAVAANTNYVAAFTTGWKGTVNSTYFQVNVTEMIVSGRVELNVTIHPDTVVKEISFYVIRADVTSLLTHCWIFTEIAITRASYGAQYTFYTPRQVLFDTNYISGLHSFSLRNNQQYNFTISSLNFSTYTNSFYNDASHFNLWLRQCPSPYTYFNKVDFKCYTICPAGTYSITVDALCAACDYTCATCTDNTTCVTCGANRISDGAGGCPCMDYFYELNGVCVSCHYSCQKCTYSGQYFNCMACDSAMHRTPSLPNNSTCNCSTGFHDIGGTLCGQICGDGKLYVDPCDDWNTNNDDGCSSTCQKEPYFDCDNAALPALVQPASTCYFVGNITVKIVRIEKDPYSNMASFYLQIGPFVPKFKDLTAQNMVTNVTGAAFAGFSLDGELIRYNITYPSDFEGTTIMFGLKPSVVGAFSRFFPKNDTVVATANNGLLLNAYSTADYTQAATMGLAARILGLIYSAMAVIFCFFDWKQIGLQLFFSLQLAFMSSVVLPYYNPFSTQHLQIKSVMGWNGQLLQQNKPYLSVPVLQHMGYSVAYQSNFNIMVIFPGLALLLYCCYRVLLYRHERSRLQGETSKDFEETMQGKILKYFKFDLFVYWMLFNMQQVLLATVIQGQYIQNGGIYVYIVICLIGIVISIVGLFIRPGSMEAYRKKLFHKNYGNKTFLIVLVSVLIMDLFLLLSVLVKKQVFYAMFVGPFIISVYLIARRPFRLMWNNIRLLIIQLCLISIFALQVATMNTTYAYHKTLPIGILVCMGIMVLVTLVAIIYDIVKKICKTRRKEDYQDTSKYQSEKEEESINEKVREAGFALVHGNSNASRLPPVYQMSNIPTSPNNRSRLKRSHVQPLRSPVNDKPKSTLKQYNDDKIKNSSKLKSKLKEDASQFNTKEKEKERPRERSNTNRNYEQLKNRADTEQKTDRPSGRRPNYNPYTQILNETASRYK